MFKRTPSYHLNLYAYYMYTFHTFHIWCHLYNISSIKYRILPGHMREGEREGGWAGTSVRGPKSQEVFRESLKGNIALTVLFYFFIFLFVCFFYFQLFFVYLEKIIIILCQIHLGFWILVVDHMKVYQWFYWTSNPQFWEKSQSITGSLNRPLLLL